MSNVAQLFNRSTIICQPNPPHKVTCSFVNSSKVPSRQESDSFIRNHSRIALSTSSILRKTASSQGPIQQPITDVSRSVTLQDHRQLHATHVGCNSVDASTHPHSTHHKYTKHMLSHDNNEVFINILNILRTE